MKNFKYILIGLLFTPILALGAWTYSSIQVGSSPTNGDILQTDGTNSTWVATSTLGLGGGGSGTVTSVDMSVPTGLTISGNPITTAGTLALSLTSGYNIPKTASTTDWQTAFGWGNHAIAGYLTDLLGGLNGIFGNSTTTNATTTSLGINSETFTDLTGSGLSNSSGSLTLDMTSANSWSGLQTFANASTTGIHTINQLCFLSGNCMEDITVEGSGITLFPWNTTTDIATYEGLRTLPDTGAEVDESCAATSGYCASNIDTYVSTSTLATTGALSLSKIPAGVWTFNAFTYVNNASGNTKLEFTVYRRVGAVETQLFQATSTDINVTTITPVSFTSTQSAFAFDPTDRLVIKVRGWSDSAVARTVHWVYENGNHYSHIDTPITIASQAIAFLPANNAFTGNNTFTGTSIFGIATSTGKMSSYSFMEAPYFSATSTTEYSSFASRIGIGTTSPYTKLSINQSTGDIPFIVASSTMPHSSLFQIGPNGNVMIGTGLYEMTFGGVTYPIKTVIHTQGDNLQADLELHRFSNIALGGALMFGSRARGSESSPAIVQNNDDVVGIFGTAFDGIDYEQTGSFQFEIDGTPGSGDMPGRIIMATTPDGSTVPVERMRVTNSGNIGIGTTSPYAKLSVVGEIVAAYFIATTTTASTFPYASTTQIGSTDNAYFGTNGTSKVGIGTTTPLNELSIYKNNTTGGAFSIGNDASSLRFITSSGANYIQSGLNTLVSGSSVDLHFTDYLNANTWMTIASTTGRVGIGTTNPRTNFNVNANSESGYFGTGANSSVNLSFNGRALFGYDGTNAVIQGGASKGVEFNVNSGTMGAGTAMTINSDTSIDAGGALSFEIPSGATPTVDATGEIAINTTQASSSLQYFDGTSSRTLSPFSFGGLPYASSTLSYMGGYGSSGTTTILLMNSPRNLTLTEFYVKLTGGTSAKVCFGDGTATTTCAVGTPSGVLTTPASNNTWTRWENLYVEIGTQVGDPAIITISPQFLKNE